LVTQTDGQAGTAKPIGTLFKILAAKTPKIYKNKICVFFHKLLGKTPYLNGYIPNRNKPSNTTATAHNTILYIYLNT
jgi:hypothetical protein